MKSGEMIKNEKVPAKFKNCGLLEGLDCPICCMVSGFWFYSERSRTAPERSRDAMRGEPRVSCRKVMIAISPITSKYRWALQHVLVT